MEIDGLLGNCVYCFMKGPEHLYNISQMADPERKQGTPSDIGWWSDLEKQYVRTTTYNKNPDKELTFYFQGSNKASFADISEGNFPEGRSRRGFMSGQQKLAMPVTIDTGPVDISCECTD